MNFYISHLAIYCSDLEAVKLFYMKWFGAKCNEKYVNPKKGFESYFLSFEKGASLEIMRKITIPFAGQESGEEIQGLTHFAFSVGSEEMVYQITDKMRAEEIRIVGEPRWTGDGFYESIVLDPEGNRVEITI